MFRELLASMAAATLVAAPVVANAAPRTGAPVEGEAIAENPWIPILVGLAVAIAILFVVLDDDEEPASP